MSRVLKSLWVLLGVGLAVVVSLAAHQAYIEYQFLKAYREITDPDAPSVFLKGQETIDYDERFSDLLT